MNLTSFVLKWEEMWKKQPSQHQTCRQNIRHQKFVWEHHIWCHVNISGVATLVSMGINDQARNQLGSPGGRRVFWEGIKFLNYPRWF